MLLETGHAKLLSNFREVGEGARQSSETSNKLYREQNTIVSGLRGEVRGILRDMSGFVGRFSDLESGISALRRRFGEISHDVSTVMERGVVDGDGYNTLSRDLNNAMSTLRERITVVESGIGKLSNDFAVTSNGLNSSSSSNNSTNATNATNANNSTNANDANNANTFISSGPVGSMHAEVGRWLELMNSGMR